MGTRSGEVAGDQRGQGRWGSPVSAHVVQLGLGLGQPRSPGLDTQREVIHSPPGPGQVASRCPAVLADLQEVVTRVSESLTTLGLEPGCPPLL